jgi:hypothetical protein
MFEEDLREFCEKNNLGDEGVSELLELFNGALLEVGRGILDSVKEKSKNKSADKSTKITKNSGVEQKWASKVSANYAMENNLTLDDFHGIEKVTKQHILDLLKENGNTKEKQKINKSSTSSSNTQASPKTSASPKTTSKKKVQCNGFNTKGACTRTGTVIPNGAKNSYCFRCAENWNDFETAVSSDSDSNPDSDSEPEPESEPKIVKSSSSNSLSEEPILD